MVAETKTACPGCKKSALIVNAAKRWYGALTLDDRAHASQDLTHAVKRLLDQEAKARREPRC